MTFQFPLFTPNSLISPQPSALPELQPRHLCKRARYLQKCKDALWSRWTTEYLRGLRERHRPKHKEGANYPTRGDVVIIKSEEKNRGYWKLGIIEELLPGRDGVVRATRLRAGKSYMERPVQHLYSLEMSCGLPEERPRADLNPNARAFSPRRNATVVARARIQNLAQVEQ